MSDKQILCASSPLKSMGLSYAHGYAIVNKEVIILESRMVRQIENVKDRKITVLEIVKERLALLERHKSCNAVICYDEKTVLEQAAELDSKIKAGKNTGKLCGAVITVKDNLEVKGLRATAGMKKFQNNIPSQDCDVVKKLRDEGAIILGKPICLQVPWICKLLMIYTAEQVIRIFRNTHAAAAAAVGPLP